MISDNLKEYYFILESVALNVHPKLFMWHTGSANTLQLWLVEKSMLPHAWTV